VLRLELLELLSNGENTGVEFKRDDLAPHDLAKALVAMANSRGGRVLLGVEDDASISGVNRADVEEWVLTVARDKVRPPLIPHLELLRHVEPGRDVLAITVDSGYAVHARWHHNSLTYFIRVGKQSREASPEELSRLQQHRGDLRAELRPVPGVPPAALDHRRLVEYFSRIRAQSVPESAAEWDRILLATELAVEGVAGPVCTVAGVLLFAPEVGRLLPHSGIDAVAHQGTEKSYAARERATLKGPMTALSSETGLVDRGVVEQALDFVARNTRVTAALDGGRRIERPTYPAQVIREAVVNALVHRDYLLTSTDIELSIYDDRLEVISPGRLPNGVTTDSMQVGVRAARNQLLKDTMRDYGYVEHMGLGVPRKIIRGMLEHNGKQPEFIESDERLTVRLWS